MIELVYITRFMRATPYCGGQPEPRARKRKASISRNRISAVIYLPTPLVGSGWCLVGKIAPPPWYIQTFLVWAIPVDFLPPGPVFAHKNCDAGPLSRSKPKPPSLSVAPYLNESFARRKTTRCFNKLIFACCVQRRLRCLHQPSGPRPHRMSPPQDGQGRDPRPPHEHRLILVKHRVLQLV